MLPRGKWERNGDEGVRKRTAELKQEARDKRRGYGDEQESKKERRLTEGHLGEKVVHDMVVGHVVEEKAAHPAEEVAVHRRGRAPLEVPLRLAIVRQLRVRVVKVRDHDEPARSGPMPKTMSAGVPYGREVGSVMRARARVGGGPRRRGEGEGTCRGAH